MEAYHKRRRRLESLSELPVHNAIYEGKEVTEIQGA
jgi:hypothetical protein